MMIFNPLNQEVYDKVQVELGYCKLFPHILKDFITRVDMAQILSPNNLPVGTQVSTLIIGTAGPTPVTGTGQGKGTGLVTPVYNGSTPSPGSEALKTAKEAARKAGGTTIKNTIQG